jgi:hypothetical protein
MRSNSCRGSETKRPRKAAEKAIALGEDDPFDYALALELGQSHGWVQHLPYDEYLRWRAYMKWRQVQQAHAQDVAARRARR